MKRGITVLGLAATIFMTVGGGLALAQAGPRPAGPAARGTPAPAALPPVTPGIPYITEARPDIANLPTPPLTPRNAADLNAIQQRVEAVQKYSMPATVGILMADGQGSGVIVSKDGYVLTAGHVSGAAGARVRIVLSNGQLVDAVSLGANNQIDSGMIKITTPGEYPFVPVGNDSRLVTGQWVVAMGHPGGYRQGRPPVVRLGRILITRSGDKGYVGTDCPLINGDSGGPLFDLDGRLIGINSRIGPQTTTNLHVPVDTFVTTWDRLAKGEVWGGTVFARGPSRSGPEPVQSTPRLGLSLRDDSKGPVIQRVIVGTGAEDAGLKENDVVTKFDGQIVKTEDDLLKLLAKHKIGDVVPLEILRSTEPRQVNVKLGGS